MAAQLALAPVAYHAGVDGQGVDYSVRDCVEAPAVEVGYSGGRACAGTGCAAVGRERADAALKVYGDEIGHGQRTVERVLVGAELFGVDR